MLQKKPEFILFISIAPLPREDFTPIHGTHKSQVNEEKKSYNSTIIKVYTYH